LPLTATATALGSYQIFVTATVRGFKITAGYWLLKLITAAHNHFLILLEFELFLKKKLTNFL
jgi:hypothetical protein